MVIPPSYYLHVKEHTLTKYRIHEKYLRACLVFQKNYDNFAYIDTHGGSGNVYYKGRLRAGSPVIAAKTLKFPCHIIEIDPYRFKALQESVKCYPHVRVYYGDCNKVIDRVLSRIECRRRFFLCFIDPDGIVYNGVSGKCLQLTWNTVEKIAGFPRSEILLNFPLEAIIRLMGFIRERRSYLSQQYSEYLTSFFGEESWMNYIHLRGERLRNALLSIYKEKLQKHFEYFGAFLVRTSRCVPVYYLIHTTNHPVGAKIMYDIFMKEIGERGKDTPPKEYIVDGRNKKDGSLLRFL